MEAHARGNEVRLSGEEHAVEVARNVLEQLYGVLRSGRPVHSRDVRAAIGTAVPGPNIAATPLFFKNS